MMKRRVLEVSSLTAGYEEIDVLKNVELALHEGEMLGIVGPNGSGKSTLLRAITRLLKPRTGEIEILGTNLTKLEANALARLVAVVPQAAVLPEGFSALEVTLMGRTPFLRLLQTEGAEDLRIARRAMLQTDTLKLSDRAVGDISGGERQRVIVARALAQQSPILLLDEPTVHLDIGHQVALLDLVRSLAEVRQISVIAVIHDLTLAAQYCDRLVMLDRGRIVAEGSPTSALTPEIIAQVYDTRVEIMSHPATGRPVVLTIPGTSRIETGDEFAQQSGNAADHRGDEV